MFGQKTEPPQTKELRWRWPRSATNGVIASASRIAENHLVNEWPCSATERITTSQHGCKRRNGDGDGYARTRRVSRISGSAHLQQQPAHTNTSAGPDARWWWCTTAVPIASMFAPPLGTRVPRSTLINPGAFAVCVGAPGHLDVLPRGVLGYSLAPLNTRVPQNARGNPCRSITQ
jgi:hypothetical protein